MDRSRMVAAAVCSLGGLVFGYDLGALAAATRNLRAQFHLTPFLFGMVISASLWGTVGGSLLAGWLADRIGRRALIGACALVYALTVLSAVLLFPSNWHIFTAMRFLSGIAVGGLTVGCPLYLAEIAPPAARGRVVGLFQLQIGIGVVLAFTAGFLLAHDASGSGYWRWCLGLGAAPALVLLFLLDLIQREPRRLAAGEPGLLQGPAPRRPSRLFRRKHLRPLLLATSVAVFNQLTGVNVLLIYLLDILANAGIGRYSSHTFTVALSALNLGTTVLSMICVDALGRRVLLVLGSAGMAFCLFGLGFALPFHLGALFYLAVLVSYSAFFAFSQGAVVWVYLSELFPFGVRGTGQGYGTSVHWIANAALIWIFPLVEKTSPSRPFYFFALMMILQIVVALLWYPETRGTALGSAEPKAARLG